MATDKKIAKVKELLQAGPMSVKELIAETGITKATAYSLPYYLGKQGFQIAKGENALKEATYHIIGKVEQPKIEVAKEPVVKTESEAIIAPATVTGRLSAKDKHESAKPRSNVTRALAGKAAKKAK